MRETEILRGLNQGRRKIKCANGLVPSVIDKLAEYKREFFTPGRDERQAAYDTERQAAKDTEGAAQQDYWRKRGLLEQPQPQSPTAFNRGTAYVEGPGTGTSDSVDAKISKGEAVLPAKTVQKVGAGNIARLIQETNDGIPPKRGLRDGMKAAIGTVEEEAVRFRKINNPARVLPENVRNMSRDRLNQAKVNQAADAKLTAARGAPAPAPAPMAPNLVVPPEPVAPAAPAASTAPTKPVGVAKRTMNKIKSFVGLGKNPPAASATNIPQPAATTSRTGRALAAGAQALGPVAEAAAPAVRLAGKVAPPLMLADTAVSTTTTPTSQYEKRFGFGPSDPEGGVGSLARDVGVRGLGAASDLGNVLTLGQAGRFYRDKQGMNEPPAVTEYSSAATDEALSRGEDLLAGRVERAPGDEYVRQHGTDVPTAPTGVTPAQGLRNQTYDDVKELGIAPAERVDLGMGSDQTSRIYKSKDEKGQTVYSGLGGTKTPEQKAYEAERMAQGNQMRAGLGLGPVGEISNTGTSFNDILRRGGQSRRRTADQAAAIDRERIAKDYDVEASRREGATEAADLKYERDVTLKGLEAQLKSQDPAEKRAAETAAADLRKKGIEHATSRIPAKLPDGTDNPAVQQFIGDAEHTLAKEHPKFVASMKERLKKNPNDPVATKLLSDPSFMDPRKGLGGASDAVTNHLHTLNKNKELMRKLADRTFGSLAGGTDYVESSNLANYDFATWTPDSTGTYLKGPEGLKVKIADLQIEDPNVFWMNLFGHGPTPDVYRQNPASSK